VVIKTWFVSISTRGVWLERTGLQLPIIVFRFFLAIYGSGGLLCNETRVMSTYGRALHIHIRRVKKITNF